MFFRLLLESFRRERGRKLLAAAAILLGTTAITAMAALALSIGDSLARELNNTYGANLVVYPRAATVETSVAGIAVKPAAVSLLREQDLPKLKSIFWRNNITALSPELSVPVTVASGGAIENAAAVGTWFHHSLANAPEDFRTGAPATHPWWKLQGSWPDDTCTSATRTSQSEPEGEPAFRPVNQALSQGGASAPGSPSLANTPTSKTCAVSNQAVLGSTLATKLHATIGNTLTLNHTPIQITGIVTTGDTTDTQALVPLSLAQQLSSQPGGVDRVLVTAVTKPEDAFARRDPATLSPKDHDRWYCSPYANSIALQINEAVPGAAAGQLRAVAQGESTVLARISGLMLFIGIAALTAAVLAVSAAMSAAIQERAQEMALMRSMGATRRVIVALLFSEVALLAVVASLLGWAFGSLLAWQVSRHLFAQAAPVSLALPPLVVALGVLVALAGAAAPVRRTLRLAPALVLHGGR